MQVKIPKRYIGEFYGKTEEEINTIVEEALGKYFKEDEMQPSATSELRQSFTVSMLMQILNKLDSLEEMGIKVPLDMSNLAKTVQPVEEVITYDIKLTESEKGSADEESIDDFLLDILK